MLGRDGLQFRLAADQPGLGREREHRRVAEMVGIGADVAGSARGVRVQPLTDPARLFGAIAIMAIDFGKPVAVGVTAVARRQHRIETERVGDRAGVEFGCGGRHQQAKTLIPVAGDGGACPRRDVGGDAPRGEARRKAVRLTRGQVRAEKQAEGGGLETVAAVEA